MAASCSERRKSPAATSSNSAIATCAATRPCRSHVRRRSAVAFWPCRAGATSNRVACSAGRRANRIDVSAASRNANVITRGSIRSSSASGSGNVGRNDDSRPTRAATTGTLNAPASSASSTPSASNWPRIRPRDAPMASRVATSRRRSSARASSIAATLLQAISSTRPVSTPSTATNPTTGPMIIAGTRRD